MNQVLSTSGGRSLLHGVAFRIALIYLVTSVSWMLLSDRILYLLGHDPESVAALQTLKAWLFILASTILAYLLVARFLGKVRGSTYELHESERRHRHLSKHFPNGMIFLYDSDLVCSIAGGDDLVKLGCCSGDFEGKRPAESFPSDAAGVMAHHLKRASQGKQSLFELVAYDDLYMGRSLPVYGDDGTLVGIMAMLQNITDRKLAMEALHPGENTCQCLFDSMNEALALFRVERDTGGLVTDWIVVEGNHSFEAIMQQYPGELTGKKGSQLFDGQVFQAFLEKVRIVVEGRAADKFEVTFPGAFTEHRVSLFLSGSDMVGALIEDATERKHMQRQFMQAQKMEIMGRLAGGVAHDFNNMLTAIIGNVDLALDTTDPTSDLHDDLSEIRHTAERAAKLTRHLLSFSRQDVTEPIVFNLNTMLLDMDNMLRRLIGADVELVTLPGESLWSVHADIGQIEQVLTNLVVNSRDALPGGGKIIIETANVMISKDDNMGPDVHAGPYSVLKVKDTGIGMAVDVLSRIFDPFFTTKEKGKGTGLGLATCYAVIKKNSGFIRVDSCPGMGTDMTIFLPATPGEIHDRRSEEVPVNAATGTETILVVEDEPAVRRMIVRILDKHGYNLIEAENGENALRVIGDHDGGIDLLVTDVIMPQMGGKELSVRITAEYPNIRILFVSGYTDDSFLRRGILEEGIDFLQKPFTSDALMRKIRGIMDRDIRG